MRLTAEVLLGAEISVNPLRERELNLRGYKAPAIENLGVTKDGFDCIDLSDNEVKKLENFPRLRRLRMLLLHNNYISRIEASTAHAIENLEYLILTNNRLADLVQIDNLVTFHKLDTLSCVGNPITKRKYYREYVIHTLPQLRVLDFHRIRPKDREAADMFFLSPAGQKFIKELHGEEYHGIEVTEGVQQVSVAPPAVQTKVKEVVKEEVAAPVESQGKVEVKETTTVVEETKEVDMEKPVEETELEMKEVVMEETPAPVETVVKDDLKEGTSPAQPSAEETEDVEMDKSTFDKPIEKLTVVVLREELKKRDLSTKGLKAELVKRLKEAVGE